MSELLDIEDAPTFVKPDAKATGKPGLTDKVKEFVTPKPKPTPRGRKPDVPHRPGGYAEDLAMFYTMIGMAITPIDETIGEAFIENAENCAEKMDKLAQKNAKVRMVLNAILTTGEWGDVLWAHAPILVAVFAFTKKPREEKKERLGNVVDMVQYTLRNMNGHVPTETESETVDG